MPSDAFCENVQLAIPFRLRPYFKRYRKTHLRALFRLRKGHLRYDLLHLSKEKSLSQHNTQPSIKCIQKRFGICVCVWKQIKFRGEEKNFAQYCRWQRWWVCIHPAKVTIHYKRLWKPPNRIQFIFELLLTIFLCLVYLLLWNHWWVSVLCNWDACSVNSATMDLNSCSVLINTRS